MQKSKYSEFVQEEINRDMFGNPVIGHCDSCICDVRKYDSYVGTRDGDTFCEECSINKGIKYY